MKQLIQNILGSKYSTGVGVVALILVIVVMAGVDITPIDNLAKWLDISPDMLVLFIGLGVSGIMNLFSKDPNKNE